MATGWMFVIAIAVIGVAVFIRERRQGKKLARQAADLHEAMEDDLARLRRGLKGHMMRGAKSPFGSPRPPRAFAVAQKQRDPFEPAYTPPPVVPFDSGASQPQTQHGSAHGHSHHGFTGGGGSFDGAGASGDWSSSSSAASSAADTSSFSGGGDSGSGSHSSD